MTGKFEVFIDENVCFRFRLKAPNGDVETVSRAFPDKFHVPVGSGLNKVV
ncbi:MAG TPA: hypothetical protein VFI36_05020 [Arthrobacter sp.]|nr:hypothetical protein [Arthrobacter sp.]